MPEMPVLVTFATKNLQLNFRQRTNPIHLVCPNAHARSVSALSILVGTIVLNMLEMPVLATFATENLWLNFSQQAHPIYHV